MTAEPSSSSLLFREIEKRRNSIRNWKLNEWLTGHLALAVSCGALQALFDRKKINFFGIFLVDLDRVRSFQQPACDVVFVQQVTYIPDHWIDPKNW